MRRLAVLLPLVLGALALGCGAHTSLEPLGRGQLSPHVSVGGPIVEAFGGNIPIPYLLVGADYGLSEDVNLSGGLHLLPLPYGVLGADLGVTYFLLANEGWRPTLGLGPRAYVFASLREGVDTRAMVLPVVSGSAAWAVPRGMGYLGADLAVPLSDADYDQEAAAVLLSPFVGYRWDFARRYALHLELKWHGANVGTDEVVTEYTALGGRGALAPLVALQRRF
jgi:hypothetical protein